MIEVRGASQEELDKLAEGAGVDLPIEQTACWASYQETVADRMPWECVVIERDGCCVAVASLFDYQTHGYHYLRSHHGPLWLKGMPSADEEREALEALSAYVCKRDSRQLFMRLSVWHELDLSSPTLSSIPYDSTVVVDVTGGDEAILSRMKPRGRRDVRKSIREAPIVCADETEQALVSFDPYYQIMIDTANRDGFAIAPQSDFESMLHSLGVNHVRLYAGRLEDGMVCTWSLCTISGSHATRYYAASRTDTMRLHVSDRLCYFECCELGRIGCKEYDLMAIGSEFSPQLMGLNEFKTKFCKEITSVAPDRDVALRKMPYGMLCRAKAIRRGVAALRAR